MPVGRNLVWAECFPYFTSFGPWDTSESHGLIINPVLQLKHLSDQEVDVQPNVRTEASLPVHTEGKQNIPFHNMPLWYFDYFE